MYKISQNFHLKKFRQEQKGLSENKFWIKKYTLWKKYQQLWKTLWIVLKTVDNLDKLDLLPLWKTNFKKCLTIKTYCKIKQIK